MPWKYIKSLLGPGLHWGKSREHLKEAIKQAELDNMPHAADHIRVILELRDDVNFDQKEPR